MNQWKAVAAFLLLCTGSLRAENPKFHPVTDGGIGLARYRVAIDFSTAADPDAFVRQLLATCRCRQEPYAELGFEGVMIVATPAAAELLSRDARVVTVEEVPPLPVAAPPAAPATPPPSTVEPTPVADAPTAPAMSAVSSPVSNNTQLVVPSPTTDSTAFWSRAYGYDKSGNVVTAGLDQYAYDRLGRVTYADAGPGKKQQYTYDRYGNLLTIVENGNTSATVDLRPDPATNRISGNGNVIAAYDTAGRMTSATGLTAKYDGEDTVVESTIQNGTTVRRVHLYSAAGERVATLTVNNSGNELSSAWTIRDPGGKVLRRLTRTNGLPGSWRWDEDYIYRDGQMLAAEVDTPARTLHYHLDHLGTPRVITGNGGAVIGQHTYHAFGKEATDPVQEAEAQKFTGHERDAEFLDYMHARYYNAYWGRFLSVDPGKDWDIYQPQSWNTYSYVRNNPINNTDPDGKWCVPCLAPLAPIALRAGPAVQRAYIYLSNPANVQRIINTGQSIVAVGVTLSEGIYEFPDEEAPGKTYVGQSEDTDRRISEHEASGRKDPDKDAEVTEVKGGKTAREHAEQNRINELGGKSSVPGSQTSNKVNPIGPKRQPTVEEAYGPIKPPRPRVVPDEVPNK